MTQNKINIPNTPRTAAIVWWILSFVFFIGIFTPGIAGIAGLEHNDWEYALTFISLVMCITSIVVGIMYTKRGRAVASILRGENLLAHWVYTKEEWQNYTRQEHGESKRGNRNLFLLVAVISVIIGIVFVIAKPEDWAIFVYIILGIIAVAGFSAWLAVTLDYRRNLKYQGETFITMEGAFVNRVLHLWKGFGAALEGVAYEADGRQIPVLRIDYSMMARNGRQTYTVRIPVPRGRDKEAGDIAERLAGPKITEI